MGAVGLAGRPAMGQGGPAVMGLSRLPLAMISAVFLLFPLADCGGGGGGWRGCWPADQPGRRAGVRGPCSLAEASDAMETKWRGCAGLRLRGGDSDSDEDGSGMELQGMTSSTDEGGGGKKDAESEGHAAQGGANSVLDDTDLDDPSVIDDGDKLSEEDDGAMDVFVADPFEQARPKSKSKTTKAVVKLSTAPAEAELPEESAESGDRSEGDEPFYNGVRVRNLFVDADTGAQEWHTGTVKYVRRTTGEYRIYFDGVPSWEASKKIFWPMGDADMKMAAEEEQRKSDKEVEEMTRSLLAACKDAHWFQARKLVFMGADASARDGDMLGMGPIHMASLEGSTEMVEYLIEAGASAIEPSLDGHTPLHWAAASGNEDTIKALIRRGARANARNLDDILPVEMARLLEHEGAEKLLVKHMERQKASEAVQFLDEEGVRKLISTPIDEGGGPGVTEPVGAGADEHDDNPTRQTAAGGNDAYAVRRGAGEAMAEG